MSPQIGEEKAGSPAFFACSESILAWLRGRPLLFVPSSQALMAVDPAIGDIWSCLRRGAFEDEVERLAAAAQRSGAKVIADLAAAGVVGRVGPEDLAAMPVGRVYLRIGGATACVWFDDREIGEALLGAWAHLACSPCEVDHHVVVVRRGDRVAVASGDDEIEWLPPDQAAPALKIALAELALAHLEGDIALHVSTLVRDGAATLLTGSPGSGKSTLSVALGRAGYHLAGDDVAELRAGGQVRAVPFPATLKVGAWDLLARDRPDLRDAPDFLRADGQRVRYLPLARREADWLPVRRVLALSRDGSAEPWLEPLEPEAALETLLADAWWYDERLSPAGFDGLLACVEGAEAFRLHYSDLSAAVALLDRTGEVGLASRVCGNEFSST